MTEERRRELAIQRIKARHDFRIHLIAYVVVNAALVVLWYLTNQGADGELGFFWPVIPIVGWGMSSLETSWTPVSRHRGRVQMRSVVARGVEDELPDERAVRPDDGATFRAAVLGSASDGHARGPTRRAEAAGP